MSPLLKIEDLSLWYPGVQGEILALDKVNLSLGAGQIVGVVGESGSGKSSLCLSILRLLEKESRAQGQIFYHGEDLRAFTENKMRNVRGHEISMVFQNPSSALNPVLRVGDQIAEALWVHKGLHRKDSRPLVHDLMKNVGLDCGEELYDRYPHQFSGGEQQRIMIASAIACKPQLLLADEPTTALDTIVQRQIIDRLLRLRQDLDMSVLYVSHDLKLVTEIADVIYVMRQGQIIEYGTTKEVFENPKKQYTQELVTSFKTKIPKAKSKIEKPKKVLCKAQGLSKVFAVKKNLWGAPKKWKSAVSSIDLEIERGDIVGLVGESGSGKSTLGLLLMALLKPSNGSVSLFDNDLWKMSAKDLRQLRRRAQIVFQSSSQALNPKRTVGESIAEPLKIHGLTKSRQETLDNVHELLKTVELPPLDFAEKYPYELSGGELQRVCIARALACQPEFIIFDESVRSLDASIQKQIVTLLLQLKKEKNLTYLFISHDLNMVEQISDKVLVMQEGKIVESGDAAKVFSQPKSLYLKRLLQARY